jgi:hypothetical protein
LNPITTATTKNNNNIHILSDEEMASHLLPLTQFKDIQHALNLVLGEDDEDDDFLAIEMIYGEQLSTKRSKYQYPRIDWQDHLQELHAARPNEFHIRYHA